MTTVAVHNLNKSYAETTAVDDLSFSVDPGEILGLIGPNGAGKSTTIKTILDFMKPDSGEITIFGHQMNEAAKNQIGYLPEEKGLYHNMRAIDLILYLASLKGMGKGPAIEKADDLLKRTGMFESKKKKIKEMSKGMGQMIQFIVTIIHDPQLLILDEPFSGLDPVNTEIMKTMVGELRDEGKAIIFSTHQMNQVEELGDRVLMINHGRAVLYGELAESKTKFRKNSVQIQTDREIDRMDGVIDQRRKNGFVELFLSPGTDPQQILDQVRQSGATISHFEITTPSLHEIFLELAKTDSKIEADKS
jgi:ABC-2 type transport system ATP-binding protein